MQPLIGDGETVIYSGRMLDDLLASSGEIPAVDTSVPEPPTIASSRTATIAPLYYLPPVAQAHRSAGWPLAVTSWLATLGLVLGLLIGNSFFVISWRSVDGRASPAPRTEPRVVVDEKVQFAATPARGHVVRRALARPAAPAPPPSTSTTATSCPEGQLEQIWQAQLGPPF